MQIFQDQQATLLGGQPAQQPQQPFTEQHRRIETWGWFTWQPLRHQPPQRGKERPQAGQGHLVPATQAAENGLGQRTERHRHPTGHRPTAQHRQPGQPRLVAELANQPRLTDAGLTHDEVRAALTGAHPAQHVEQNPTLLLPPDEHRAPHLPHAPSITATQRPARPTPRGRPGDIPQTKTGAFRVPGDRPRS
jgi:hypothetical protein